MTRPFVVYIMRYLTVLGPEGTTIKADQNWCVYLILDAARSLYGIKTILRRFENFVFM